ncbi:helix-turn-helix transcriptional regulator [Solirhodobacter olei]|uniref:helix-turn-helix transcriptional regulator n=1 Tax=Solirhodobacter olei TaxID=2493082 RepID=UPI000FD79F64|nr:LuxR family transcriptional regulator [Solirhodobacter olei]
MLATFERMLEAGTVPEVWQLYLETVAGFGFQRVLYGYSLDQQGDPYGLDNAVYLSNHEAAYMDTFIGKEMYRDAPMVRWAAENVGAQSWRHVARAYAEGTLSPAARRVIEFNRLMGIVTGYTVSFKDVSTRSKGAIGLVGGPGMSQDAVDEVFESNRRHLIALSTLLHLKVTNLPRQGPRALTQRQREALEWVAEGKTTQDIAVLMNISTAMVEKHLRLAREALDVDTTAHAVAKASRLHMIFSSDA